MNVQKIKSQTKLDLEIIKLKAAECKWCIATQVGIINAETGEGGMQRETPGITRQAKSSTHDYLPLLFTTYFREDTKWAPSAGWILNFYL